MIPVGWLLLSVLIGFLGRDRVMGFWGYAIISVILSPLVGAIAVAASGSIPRR